MTTTATMALTFRAFLVTTRASHAPLGAARGIASRARLPRTAQSAPGDATVRMASSTRERQSALRAMGLRARTARRARRGLLRAFPISTAPAVRPHLNCAHVFLGVIAQHHRRLRAGFYAMLVLRVTAPEPHHRRAPAFQGHFAHLEARRIWVAASCAPRGTAAMAAAALLFYATSSASGALRDLFTCLQTCAMWGISATCPG